MKTFEDLHNEHVAEARKLEHKFAKKAAKCGFAVGDLVQNNEGIYRITRLFSRGLMIIYGVKLRKNGTFGTHEHYVSFLFDGVVPYRGEA